MSQPAPTPLGALGYPQSHGIVGKSGPYKDGSDYWAVAIEDPDAVGPANFVAYKNQVRMAVGPYAALVGGNPGTLGQVDVRYRETGTVIDIAAQDPTTGELFSLEFDMGGGVFQNMSMTGIVITPATLGNLAMAVDGAGKQVMCWYEIGGPVYISTKTAGVWNTPVEVDDGSASNWWFDQIVINDDGDIVILYTRGNSIGSSVGNKLWAIYDGTSITSRGTTGLSGTINLQPITTPLFDSNSDSVVFPIFRTVTSGFFSVPQVALLIGTPSAAPTWTVKAVKQYTVTEVTFLRYCCVTANAAGTHFDVFWYRRVQSFNYDQVETATSTTLTGSYTTVLYWSETFAPPTPAPYFVGIQPVCCNTASTGDVGVIVGLARLTPATGNSVLYSWTPGPPPPTPTATLELVVTVSGGTGVPAMFLATAVGPTTISGAGGAGPTVVPIGTYALSVALVSGYTPGSWGLTGDGILAGSNLTLADGDSAVVTINEAFAGGGPVHVRCAARKITIGEPYSGFMTATGGVPPYTWAVTSGTLPNGLTLDPVTGEISGTPTEDTDPATGGPICVTITATDSN